MSANSTIAKQNIHSQLRELFASQTPREVENILFDVFALAEIQSDGIFQEEKENRMQVHAVLRSILFEFNDQELLKMIKDE